MKFHITSFLLLILLAGFGLGEWVGHVINQCDFDIWAKSSRQPGSGGGALDSPMMLVPAGGGTYEAAFTPVYGNGEGPQDDPDHSHGITIKLEREEDPSFTTGHIYQLEYTNYFYRDRAVQWLSVDLSVVDGHPFSDVSRLAEILVDGHRLHSTACNSVGEGADATLFCSANEQPCPFEWQPGHGHSEDDPMASYPLDPACPAMNNNPECSHPMECRAGLTGVFQFTLCA